MDIDRFLDLEKRTGVKNSDIDDFLAKANAVDEAIKGMRNGTLDPATIKIDGIDCDTEEEKAEKERKRLIRRAELEREAEELRIRRKEEERKKWWAGVDLFINNDNEKSSTSVDEIDKEQLELRIRKERYSMDYSRWNQWVPNDPVSLREIEEQQEEEDRKRNEEFEKNNAEWCQQYLKDIEERDKATAKKKKNAAALKLKGNKLFKAKKYSEALEKYMEALALTPYDGPAIVTNIAQSHIKMGEYDDALEFLDRALAIDPKNIKAHSRKAFVFSECLPNRLEDALHWVEKAYALDDEHVNKEVTVQYNELKIAWSERCKEEKVSEIVVPAASKFSELMKNSPRDAKAKTSDPVLNEHMFSEIMKEFASCESTDEGSISAAAGISVVDSFKSRVEGILNGTEPNDTKSKFRNYEIFLDAVMEVLEGDSNIRIYFRTSGTLLLLMSLIRKGLSNIREAKQDNRQADYSYIGKHMKVLAVAIGNERSSKLQLLDDPLFVNDVKFICSKGDCAAEVLEGCLLLLLYGLDTSCSKMRTEILNDKQFLLSLGSTLCSINSLLGIKSKKLKPSAIDLSFFLSSQMICCQIIKEVIFADETKTNIASIARAIVPVLGSTAIGLKPSAEKHQKQVLEYIFESLLGCSQLEVLRVAFTEAIPDFTSSTIEIILELCHDNDWMISNGLAILMNLTIKDIDSVDIRRFVYDAGATDLCLAILSEEDQFASENITKYCFVRAAGLISRLSSITEVQEILQSATVYKVLCQRLFKNIELNEKTNEAWISDERNQLVRVIAAVRDMPDQTKAIGFSLGLPQLLLSLLPVPRRELNVVTPESVILPPIRSINSILLGNIALALLPYADDKEKLECIYSSNALGVEKLVCAMATCPDIRVRKNIAILLAKGCRDPVIKKKIEHFRGLQMIVELQKQLL